MWKIKIENPFKFLIPNTDRSFFSFIQFALFSNKLQAVGHQAAETLEINLLRDVLGLDGVFLLVNGHHLALNDPGVLLHPLHQLLIVDVAEKLREISFVDGLEGGADDVADELANRVLENFCVNNFL